ncbi:hypothetical protein NEPAR06_0301 [Nematocida parisii]|nr:hypothetical protein NEPAR07_0345 [Nematocida parisii]KAI5153251.1 hypothetical protein NEPAR06_0301 [Nematocida parisii]
MSLSDLVKKGFRIGSTAFNTGTEHCFKLMETEDINAVTGIILSFLFGLITPHVTNRFFVREVFNMLTGALVLSCIYQLKNFLLVLSGIPLNLILSYIPIKEKKKRTKVFILVNLVHLVVAYAFRDSSEKNSFFMLTLTAFFMKYLYIGMEYLPRTHGFMAYFGYVLFLPGIRYGPVMSFGAYQKWLSTGYLYLVETEDKAIIKRIVGETENEGEIISIKEDYVMHKYSKLITSSTGLAICSFAFIISYRAVCSYIETAQNNMLSYCKIGFGYSVLYAYKLFYIAFLWLSEEAVCQIAFINNMQNVRLLPFVTFWRAHEFFSLWNIQGSKFMHSINRLLTEEEKKEEPKEKLKEDEKTTDSPVDTNITDIRLKEHIKVSIISYGHLLLFPMNLESMLISIPTVLLIGLIKDIPTPRSNFIIYRTICEMFGWSGYILIFTYFMVPLVHGPLETLNIWRISFAYGHFLCIPGIIASLL